MPDAKQPLSECIKVRNPTVVAIEMDFLNEDPCRKKCRKRIKKYTGSRCVAVFDFFMSYIMYTAAVIGIIYNDPWCLVRPPENSGDRNVRQERIVIDGWRRRPRFAPGRNRQGEDFTDILIQGMAGR